VVFRSIYKNEQQNSVLAEQQVPSTKQQPDDDQLGRCVQSDIIKRQRCVNINISTRLHKDDKEWGHKVKIHSAAGCCSIIILAMNVFSILSLFLVTDSIVYPEVLFGQDGSRYGG
jgi:hypothetical protein